MLETVEEAERSAEVRGVAAAQGEVRVVVAEEEEMVLGTREVQAGVGFRA